jgi:hypothetical protein
VGVSGVVVVVVVVVCVCVCVCVCAIMAQGQKLGGTLRPDIFACRC